MLTGSLALLLGGILLLFIGAFPHGNATVIETERLAPPEAASIRRRSRFYKACMGLGFIGALVLCAVLGLFTLGGVDAGWLPTVLRAAAAYAVLGAVLAAAGQLRLVG